MPRALNLAQAEEILLESLKDGPGILPFNLGPTRVISHYHSFVQTINLETVHNRLDFVRNQLRDFIPKLNNITSSLYLPHIKYLDSKLDEISEQLGTFEVKRVKRGLIDGLGSVIKSISGNLDYTDAIKYDNAISVLKLNQNNLAAELNHQMSLSKQWVSRSSNVTDKIVENQVKIENMINSILASDERHEIDMTKHAHLAQLILILGDNIDSLSNEFSKIENLLAFIRANSIPHSILNYESFNSMIRRLHMLYNQNEVLDIHFRDYFDIIKLGYYYKENEIILVIKLPIVNPINHTLYRLSLAPNRNNKVLSPTSPYVAIHEKGLLYIETECPKYNHGHLCEDDPSRRNGKQSACITHLILQQRIHESCHFTTVFLSSEAMEQLDEHHYVLSFPALTKVQLTCSEDQYKLLDGSYLAVIPKGCKLQSPTLKASNHHDRVEGHILKIMDVAFNEEKPYNEPTKIMKLNTIDLSHLHSSNSKIAVQESVTLKPLDLQSIYHTTIPVYVLLIGAAALIIIFVRFRRNIMKHQNQSANPDCKENEDKEQCSMEAKDSISLSALFSTNVCK